MKISTSQELGRAALSEAKDERSKTHTEEMVHTHKQCEGELA
jgi:hypothetical protein